MRVIRKSAKTPYTAQQMFELVNAIEQYPAFLPACQASEVHIRTADQVQASIIFTKAGIRHSLTTRNQLYRNEKIEVRLVKGPFSHLHGCWRFESLAEGGCCVSFELEFAFKNHLMDLAMGPLLEAASGMVLEIFCERAKVVYGF